MQQCYHRCRQHLHGSKHMPPVTCHIAGDSPHDEVGTWAHDPAPLLHLLLAAEGAMEGGHPGLAIQPLQNRRLALRQPLHRCTIYTDEPLDDQILARGPANPSQGQAAAVAGPAGISPLPCTQTDVVHNDREEQQPHEQVLKGWQR